MAEGSYPPKERVNIVYRPATGNAQEDIELPLKMVIIGDYTLRNDETPLEERKTININKDNFNAVMRGQELRLSANVENHLSTDAEMTVDLKFATLRDFEPESLAHQVPELRKLLELRQALSALKGPLGNVREFRRALQELFKDEAKIAKLFEELGMDKS